MSTISFVMFVLHMELCAYPQQKNIRFVNFHQYYRDNIHLSEAGTATLLKGYNEFVPILNQRAQKESYFYCGENGHNTKKCRHGEKIKCFHCGLTLLNTVGDGEGTSKKRQSNLFHIHIPLLNSVCEECNDTNCSCGSYDPYNYMQNAQ